jgi:hypothetical protein
MTLEVLASAHAPNSSDSFMVSLASPSGKFGLRDAGTELIVVPAGIFLSEGTAEDWSREIVEPSPGAFYEYWLKFQHQSKAFYIPSFSCPVASLDPSSVSEAAEDDSDRSITIRREQTPLESFGRYRGDSVRVRLTVTESVDTPAEIFGSKDDSAGQNFSFVASPVDADIYPVDEADPEQSPAFYLKSQIDILVPTPEAADELWSNITDELSVKLAAQGRLETLGEASSQEIE